jgi:hypothetical protein
MITNVLEASFTTEAPLMPQSPRIFDEASLTLQNEDWFVTGFTISFGTTVGYETRPTKITIVPFCGQRVWINSCIWRERCITNGTSKCRESFLRL